MEQHAAITKQGPKFTLERFGDAKVLKNGKVITTPVDLNHLDR